MEIVDVESLQKQIIDAADLKAEKLRLWTLSIPLPRVPPLILAAAPISSKMRASELADMDISLLQLLLAPPFNFRIISLGSDGATVEREARRELERKKFVYYIHHIIPHPDPSRSPLKIEILRKGDHAMAIIQDSKHARKTIRNGMFTGAKCLTLGRYTVHYEQVRNLAFKENSPLYSRDVDKLDRQDDRAAARLFAARTLEFTIENLDNELGLIIYLFVFGEMIDAYQNRQITHLDRVKMVLRTHFFKDFWKKFLEEGGYPITQHFMSKEADDITDIIINGLIALIFIHRDYLDQPFPLLPWPHGSEPGEHVFGFLREDFPDFSMLDVLRLIPKIGVRLMAACKSKHLKGDFRKTASGYSHTYFDGTDANLQFLAVFPTDEEIQMAAASAYDEALSLWILLGYTPSESSGTTGVAFTGGNDSIVTEEAEDESLICCNTVDQVDMQSDRRDLEDALVEAAELRSKGMPSNKTDEALDECGYAAAALSINDIEQIANLPITSEADAIDPFKTLPISNINEADLTELVAIRMRNQCREGAEGVRTRKSTISDQEGPSPTASNIKPLSERQKLAQKIHEIVRLEESQQGSSTGLNRRVRWEKSAAGSIATLIEADVITGNVANARVAARAGADEIIRRRRKEFPNVPGMDPNDLATAKVNLMLKLKRGSFGVVAYDGELMIGKVITMYEKGGGKVAKHGWVSEVTSVGFISYLSVQIWKQTARNQRFFRAIWHPKLKQHGLPRFAHLPAAAFLLHLPPSSFRSHNNEAALELVPSFFESIFMKMLVQDKQVLDAVKCLLKRPMKKDIRNDENDGI
ncbi:hypothetical protein BJ912DRAFT_848156 [Pholiota molesta]|nr:hypothetical protein BJ912DRAFT_848156 [Pholiota molesta]